MSQSAERVRKFEDDAAELMREGKAARVAAEAVRLQQWITKHQNDALPPGDQQRLWSTVRGYHHYATQPRLAGAAGNDNVLAATFDLLDCCLKIPEGRLITARIKQQVLKLQQGTMVGKAPPAPAAAPVVAADWDVVDLATDGATCCVVSGDEVLDDVPFASPDIAAAVRAAIDADGGCPVAVDGNVVVRVGDS
jgi:hypothetical protein